MSAFVCLGWLVAGFFAGALAEAVHSRKMLRRVFREWRESEARVTAHFLSVASEWQRREQMYLRGQKPTEERRS